MRAFAADQDVELSSALTPREFAAAVGRRFAVEAAPFAAALERSAYAPPSARNAQALSAETDGLLRELRAAVGRRRRLLGLLSSRSVKLALAR